MCDTLLVGVVLRPGGSRSALALFRHCSSLHPLLVFSAGPCAPRPVHCHRAPGCSTDPCFSFLLSGRRPVHLSRGSPPYSDPNPSRPYSCPPPPLLRTGLELTPIELPHHLLSRPLSWRVSPSLSAELTLPRAWPVAGFVSDTFFSLVVLFFLEILRTFSQIFLSVLRSEYSFSDKGTFLS
jgi:hypothetical protein